MHVCVCALGGQWSMLSGFLNHYHLISLRQGPLLSLKLLCLDWRASSPQGSCLHSPRAGVCRSIPPCPPIMCGWGSELRSSCLCGKHLTHWATSPAPSGAALRSQTKDIFSVTAVQMALCQRASGSVCVLLSLGSCNFCPILFLIIQCMFCERE